MKLSHLDAAGRARMVDVADKAITVRTATAEGAIRMSAEAYRLVTEQAVVKGDVLAVSQVAGTMAAKRTAELIPLCHPVGLDHVEVEATLDETLPGVRVRAAAKAVGRTGVEMEALSAVSVALLTVYDMVKAVDRGMEILSVRLLEKTGGTRGGWRGEATPDDLTAPYPRPRGFCGGGPGQTTEGYYNDNPEIDAAGRRDPPRGARGEQPGRVGPARHGRRSAGPRHGAGVGRAAFAHTGARSRQGRARRRQAAARAGGRDHRVLELQLG